MSKPASSDTIPLLSKALHRIRVTPPRIIASPPTQPRRASVALIIRIVPSPTYIETPPLPQQPQAKLPSLTEFFELDWVNDPGARPDILFLQRESHQPEEIRAFRLANKYRDVHVAFPGGRADEGDEGGLYTALRQTWEEIGLDLAERDYACIGQLDDREITTSLGKRLLMILSPFVFLQLTPYEPRTDPVPATKLHWIPLSNLTTPHEWSSVSVDAASRLAPKNSAWLRVAVRALLGSMQFPAIVLDGPETPATAPVQPRLTHDILEKGVHLVPLAPPQRLKLWGLSLAMALDLLSYMGAVPSGSTSNAAKRTNMGADSQGRDSPSLQLPFQDAVEGEATRLQVVAPSLASVFPSFSYPDVNFWIWVFGKRYREVVRGWEASVRAGGTNDRRINWAGSALSTFYASVRKALVVVIVLRAIGILFGLAFAVWWVFGA